MPASIRVKDLNPSETLAVWRRRKGLTQDEAAAHVGVPYATYRDREQGRAKDVPPPPEALKGGLTTGEQCFIARRRAGLTREKVAADMGCKVKEVDLMERGLMPCHDLACYWDS